MLGRLTLNGGLRLLWKLALVPLVMALSLFALTACTSEAPGNETQSATGQIIARAPRHTVSTPTVFGPTDVPAGKEFAYGAQGATCSRGGDVAFRLSLAPGRYSPWFQFLPVAPITWLATGQRQVRAQARSVEDPSVVSDWSPPLLVMVRDPERVFFDGTADTATSSFVLVEGLARFSFLHSGSGYFGVWLYDTDGNRVDLLVNTVGNYKGSTVVGVRSGSLLGATPGHHILKIRASGRWSVMVH